MNRILITLILPELGKELEVFLPLHQSIGQIEILLKKAFLELSEGSYQKDQLIFLNEEGQVLPKDAFVSFSLLSNGDKLIIL